MAFQFHRVGGILRTNVHLQFHVDELFAIRKPAGNLMDSSSLARFDGQEFGRFQVKDILP